ncbi:ATP binding / aminoacyl-tRNA ligase/ nucleotide binding protein [Arabidopsis thaliana]|uniref:ATP binding / aminoacyl-tRNA ligase/ nucleotide binding protein n=1 Tax=Arabidopsis thaliana TaxID=3702 RepID=F4IJR9_ARATH|nr:ATP binding / aminoacyl-tRNA ligase/ nucleotide binding protein [Arabidopsis thaliana]AEC09062.1 ATP binding / aminoacyl-tRNA ligase/ nucleotide binding protein [Arabidopsis thaliana]|eukprot:NP_001154552.1 ATP binding / aminoacyl-tRNA ligase/ nucleotide binding protein [Arabidopsis thaliana]
MVQANTYDARNELKEAVHRKHRGYSWLSKLGETWQDHTFAFSHNQDWISFSNKEEELKQNTNKMKMWSEYVKKGIEDEQISDCGMVVDDYLEDKFGFSGEAFSRKIYHSVSIFPLHFSKTTSVIVKLSFTFSRKISEKTKSVDLNHPPFSLIRDFFVSWKVAEMDKAKFEFAKRVCSFMISFVIAGAGVTTGLQMLKENQIEVEGRTEEVKEAKARNQRLRKVKINEQWIKLQEKLFKK